MKTESEVRSKLRQILFRHRKKEMITALRVIPSNCIHNVKMDSPNCQIGVCGFGRDTENWNQKICDEKFGGDNVASLCPYFQTQDPDEIKKSFKEAMITPGHIAYRYPDVRALKWVLDDGDFEEVIKQIESDPESDDSEFVL